MRRALSFILIEQYAITFNAAISACEKGYLCNLCTRRSLTLILMAQRKEDHTIKFCAAISACEKGYLCNLWARRSLSFILMEQYAITFSAAISACERDFPCRHQPRRLNDRWTSSEDWPPPTVSTDGQAENPGPGKHRLRLSRDPQKQLRDEPTQGRQQDSAGPSQRSVW